MQSIAQRVAGTKIDKANPSLVEASELFYIKGANPRLIRAAFGSALMRTGTLTPDAILAAAKDMLVSADRPSITATCGPSNPAPKNRGCHGAATPPATPTPTISGASWNPASGDILNDELDKRLKELKPHANV